MSAKTTVNTCISLLGRSVSFKSPDGLASAPHNVSVTVLKSDISTRRDCGYLGTPRTGANSFAPAFFVHTGDPASALVAGRSCLAYIYTWSRTLRV